MLCYERKHFQVHTRSKKDNEVFFPVQTFIKAPFMWPHEIHTGAKIMLYPTPAKNRLIQTMHVQKTSGLSCIHYLPFFIKLEVMAQRRKT